MWPTLVLFLIELLFIFSDAGTHPSQFVFALLKSRPLWQNVQITFNISDQRKDLVLKGLPRRSSPTGSSPLSRLGTTGGEASMSKPDLRFVKFSSLCCFWFSWRENDFDTCVGSLGDDGATNHHCQHRNCRQLQTAVTWVLDELERNQKRKII